MLRFLEYKTNSFVLNFVPRTLKFAFQGFEISKFSGEARLPDPLPLEKGDERPLVDTVGYSIQTCCLLPFLIKTLEVVRAFASYQCRLGCNRDVDDACGLKLLLVLSLAWRGFSLGTLVFLSVEKPTFPN